MQQVDVERLARATLAAHPSLFLATAGDAGPWVNGVYFAEDAHDLFTLSLVLEQRGRTLAAVRSQSRVAVIVSTGSPADPFLQASAEAEELSGAEAERAKQALIAKVPQAAPFLAAPIEAVRLTVTGWRVTDIPNGWLPGVELPNPNRLVPAAEHAVEVRILDHAPQRRYRSTAIPPRTFTKAPPVPPTRRIRSPVCR